MQPYFTLIHLFRILGDHFLFSFVNKINNVLNIVFLLEGPSKLIDLFPQFSKIESLTTVCLIVRRFCNRPAFLNILGFYVCSAHLKSNNFLSKMPPRRLMVSPSKYYQTLVVATHSLPNTYGVDLFL